jgi:hypothetical protein
MTRAAIRPDDVLAECARLGVSITPGREPGKVRMTGPAEAVERLRPLVAQCKAALLEALTQAPAAPAPEPPKPDPRLTGSNYIPATEQELVRMLARVQRAEALGLSAREADTAADTLHARDRFGPHDMRLCVECARLRADRTGWRCAVLGAIPRDWVTCTLQRCNRFEG